MAAELLQINLIPEGAKRAGSTTVEQFHRAPLMWIAASFLVLLPVLMLIPLQIRKQHMQRYTGKLAALQPKLLEVRRLDQIVAQSRAQDAAFQKLGTGGELWARRLNTLATVTPPGVWFTELTLDREKGLIIQGSAVQQGEAEMVSITKLVQALKADPEFSSVMKDIQIESIKRVQDGDVEIVQFTLTCKFNEAGA